MPVWKLSFDIYHLAFYLAAILFWLCLCLLFAFNSRLLFHARHGYLHWLVPGLAVFVSGSLLLLDVIFFFDRAGMLVALLLLGFGVPAAAIWSVRLRLLR